MATIRYTFADGHSEEVEVTEEFKREYEFLLCAGTGSALERDEAKRTCGLSLREKFIAGKVRRGRLRSACGGTGSAGKAYSKRGAPRTVSEDSFVPDRKAAASLYPVSYQRL